VQWLRIAQCDGYIRIGASLPENRKRKKSLLCVFKELDDDGEGGGRDCQLTSVVLCSLFRIF